MKISDKVNGITPSLTRKLFNMAQKYEDVIDLTLGDPDFATPEKIKDAACDSIKNNLTHYSANAGLLETRKAVAKRVEKRYKVKSQEENVILTVGGMEALYLSLLCMVDDGDEVIIFAPYYVNYVQMVKLCGGNPVIINAYSNSGFKIKKEEILKRVSDKTVAIIVNSPNNPTGDIISAEFLKVIYEVACEKDLYIISDEVYRTLIYENKCYYSVLDFPDAHQRTILIDSMSKEYSMTGWRIGYARANALFTQQMVKVQENIAACAPLPSQYAMNYAYENDIDNSYVIEELQERRDFLYSRLSKIEKLRCIKPKGTFYMFIDISKTGFNSVEFAEKLLVEKHVAVVPGIAYGDAYAMYIRIAFTKNIEVLDKALKRIEEFFNA